MWFDGLRDYSYCLKGLTYTGTCCARASAWHLGPSIHTYNQGSRRPRANALIPQPTCTFVEGEPQAAAPSSRPWVSLSSATHPARPWCPGDHPCCTQPATGQEDTAPLHSLGCCATSVAQGARGAWAEDLPAPSHTWLH